MSIALWHFLRDGFPKEAHNFVFSGIFTCFHYLRETKIKRLTQVGQASKNMHQILILLSHTSRPLLTDVISWNMNCNFPTLPLKFLFFQLISKLYIWFKVQRTSSMLWTCGLEILREMLHLRLGRGHTLELASVARNSRIPDFSPSWQSDFIQTKRFLCRMISPSIQLLWPGKLVSRRFCNFRICAILYFCISVFVCFTEYCTSCVLRIYPSGRPPITPKPAICHNVSARGAGGGDWWGAFVRHSYRPPASWQIHPLTDKTANCKLGSIWLAAPLFVIFVISSLWLLEVKHFLILKCILKEMHTPYSNICHFIGHRSDLYLNMYPTLT